METTIVKNETMNGMSGKDYQEQLAQLREKEKVFEKKNWRDSIISNFDDLLRFNYNKNIVDFTQIVIEYFAENTKACQGIFYTFDHEKQCLKATAGYACNITKLPQTELLIGEGLAGQAAESHKHIFFEGIPANAIHLQSSGNIQFNVGSLLFLPLVFNAKVFGVIELLYLKDLEDKFLDLLLILSKNTAATLESILNNMLTQKLLEDAQEKENELQAQQEELMQNMEELKSIQEEMQKKQAENENFIKAVNSSGIALIEFDLEGNILNANPSFLELMKYSLEDILGKKHRIFVEEEYANSTEYQEFWNNLRNGQSQKGEFCRIAKDKIDIFIFGAYSVMKDNNDKPYKVIKLATDVTQTKILLKDVEERNKSLSTQEEELRQNLEELITVQETISTKNTEMENFLAAINNSSFALIEFDMTGTILHANAAFLEIFGYELEEVIGKKHQIFIPEEYAQSEEYLYFWQELNHGVPQKGTFKRISKDKSEIYIKGAYSVIQGKLGEPLKVLKLATQVNNLD